MTNESHHTKTVPEPVSTVVVPADVTEAMLRDLARRGTQKWQDTVAAIIAFGQFLNDAKVAAGHGNFSRLFKGHKKPVDPPMPITLHTGEALIAIAKHGTLSNSTYRSNLPPHWKTLSLLTPLSEEQVESHIRQGLISSEMTQAQAQTLLYYRTAKTQAQQNAVTKIMTAYKKRLERRETDACLCQCVSCGHVHPDQRLKSGTKPSAPSPEP